MLTIYTTPKPFYGHSAVIQENAIHSWNLLRPECEVIVFGDEEGTAEIASKYHARHVPAVARNKYGTPLVNDIFEKAQQEASYNFLCYVNADIILMNDFIRAVQRVIMRNKRALVIGRRWDIDMERLVDFMTGWEERLKRLVKQEGKPHAETGMDYFVFPRGFFENIPPFAIGRTAWDNWLIYHARMQKVPVINASESIMAVHQNHDYSHSLGGKKSPWSGPEVVLNRKIAKSNNYSFNMLDATHLLKPRRLRRAINIKYLWRRINQLPVFFPFFRLKILQRIIKISHNFWYRYALAPPDNDNKKKNRIIYVLPYEFYFAEKNNMTGGHISHIIGVVEALIDKNYSIEIISDMEVPDLSSDGVTYYAPVFRKIRHLIRLFTHNHFQGNGKSLNNRYGSIFIYPPYQLISIALKVIKYPLYCLSLFITTWIRSKSSKANFIYLRHSRSGFVPALVAKLTRIPLVIEVNTPISLGAFNRSGKVAGQTASFVGWRELIQYRFAHIISVVSPIVRDWIWRHAGTKYAKKIIVNPNGVDPKRFHPLQNTDQIRTFYHIHKDEVLVGMVAGFVWYNAIEDLVDLFQRAREIVPNMRLMLMGDSELRQKLEDYVKKRKMSDSVFFTGRIPFDKMPHHLAACDILVSHFNYGNVLPHGCSIKHLEYMAAGKPVVATEVGYVNFAIRHDVNGLLVPQGDTEGFAKALSRLALDSEMRNRLGKQGRLDAEEQHTWQTNVERILSRLPVKCF